MERRGMPQGVHGWFLGEWDKHRPVEMLSLLASSLHLYWHQENWGFSHKGRSFWNSFYSSVIRILRRMDG